MTILLDGSATGAAKGGAVAVAAAGLFSSPVNAVVTVVVAGVIARSRFGGSALGGVRCGVDGRAGGLPRAAAPAGRSSAANAG